MMAAIVMAFVFITEALTVYQYFASLFTRKCSVKRMVPAFAVGYIGLYAFSFLDMSVANIVVFTAVNAGLAALCFESALRPNVFNNILLSSLMFVSEAAVAMIATPLLGGSFHQATESVFFLTTALSKMLFFALSKVLSTFMTHMMRKQFNKSLLGLTVLLVATLTILLTVYSMLGNVAMDTPYHFVIAIAALLLLGSNVIVFGVYESFVTASQKRTAQRLADQKTGIEHEHYKMLQQQYQESRLLSHDLKNHLAVLDTLLEDDATKARKYLRDMMEHYSIEVRVPVTSNQLLDVICYQKMMECSQHGISFTVKNDGVSLGFIGDSDLCVILGNLLDNAVEACEKCSKKRWIQLSLYRHKDLFTVINMQNTCEQPPVEEGRHFKSTKANKAEHGLGLHSIEKAIQKHHGKSDYYFDSLVGNFHSTIIFRQESCRKL